MNALARWLYHAVFWPRFRFNRSMRRFARSVPAGTKVLEFGSGRPVNGEYPYSAIKHFPHCEFVQTDIEPAYGHRVLDITNPESDEQFDLVLASSVLEHVFDFEAAISGVAKLLRPGGVARISVPFMFPLHDEPHDFWRFTEHSLRRLLREFEEVTIESDGPRRFPFGYVAVVKR